VPGLRFPLPARDRVILHLSDFPAPTGGEGGFPGGITQDGIARRTGLGRAHVALALKSLREEGLVEELKGRVAGEARRRKVYALTVPGRDLARRTLAAVMEQEVALVRGDEARRARLSESSFILQRKIPLVELALAVDEGAVLNIGPDGRPVQVLEDEAAEVDEAGEGEESSGAAPAPAGTMEFPGPPPPGVELPVTAGPPSDVPTAPAAAPAPPEPPLPVSPWVRRGQLAAVWIAAAVLSGAFIWLGDRVGEPVEPGFLAMYFLVMVSLQTVLLGLGGIPANVRAELGLFLGSFLALYGGFLLLGPPFPSLLWFTEGVLLVSTGLLLAPLDGNRRFQTIGAGAGSFVILLCLQWLPRTPGPVQALFLIMWMLVGGLLLAARLFPRSLNFTVHLKTAAGLASAMFLLTIGAFLASRGLVAESFVEVLVGLVIIYYIVPRKREAWSWVLVVCTVIMCIMVVLTTLMALSALLPQLEAYIG